MKGERPLPQESLVRVFVNGDFLSSMLCTPRDVKELAVGWLYGQGHIESLSDIASLAACEDLRDVHVHLSNGHTVKEDTGRMIRTSACMGGEISHEQFLRDLPRMNGGYRVFSYSTYRCITCGSCVGNCPEDAGERRHEIYLRRFLPLPAKIQIRSVRLEPCERCGTLFVPEPQVHKVLRTIAEVVPCLCLQCKKTSFSRIVSGVALSKI